MTPTTIPIGIAKAFGIDETNWSLPHSMLNWGIYLEIIGLAACRAALAPARPMGLATRALIAFPLFAMAFEPIGGPLFGNIGPTLVRAVAAHPALVDSQPYQHTVRIFLAWNLTRESALFAPAMSFGGGVAIALVLALRPGRLVLLATAALVTAGTHIGPTPWVVLPVIIPSLVAVRYGDTMRLQHWLAAGAAFAALTAFAWAHQVPLELGDPPEPAAFVVFGVLAGVFAMPLGARAGSWIGRAMLAPHPRAVLAVAIVVGLAPPILFGAIDLWLRTHTA